MNLRQLRVNLVVVGEVPGPVGGWALGFLSTKLLYSGKWREDFTSSLGSSQTQYEAIEYVYNNICNWMYDT